jgi:hypothetical protein
MRAEAKAPSPDILGTIGEPHFRACFDAWYGVKRFWYRRVASAANGIPFVFEAALAETVTAGAIFTGVNFSPTFEYGFAIEAAQLRFYRLSLSERVASAMQEGVQAA